MKQHCIQVYPIHCISSIRETTISFELYVLYVYWVVRKFKILYSWILRKVYVTASQPQGEIQNYFELLTATESHFTQGKRLA